MEKLYPNARKNRLHGNDPQIQGTRTAFLKSCLINFSLLLLLFLGLFAYIYGSLFQLNSLVYNMGILYVDYDGGVVGSSVRDAYNTLQGPGFPTLYEGSISQFPMSGDMESAVCQTQYWGAVYTSSGASARLAAALAGGSAAATYNSSDVLTYIWNEARYSTIVDTTISGSIQTLSSAARVGYANSNGTGALQTLSPTDATAISIFANPWQLTSVNIQPTTQGSRLIYNTLVVILVMIQEFFFLGTINGLYVQFHIYERLYPRRIITFRTLISLSYTFLGSLCTTATLWAFRSSWSLNGNQFALSWATLWLFAHLNFLTLDLFTIWLPAPYVPMSLIAWMVLNVASILIPFDLSPPFYRWAYAMPAHEVYQILIDIWSRGCNPQLHIAIPILFAYEISSFTLSTLGVYRRCHNAVLAEEAREAAFRQRLDAGLAFERKREREKLRAVGESTEPKDEIERAARNQQDAQAVEKDRDELAEVLQQLDSKVQREREQQGTGRSADFGPCFDLAFGMQRRGPANESSYRRRGSV